MPEQNDPTPSPQEYADFISQIELRNIWLQSSTIENGHGPESPDDTSVQIEGNATWESTADGFRTFQHYRLTFQAPPKTVAAISITFGVDFASLAPMNDAIFALFSEVNLPINTWPFLREFVSATMGRMGWQPITLPAIKVGTRPRRDQLEPADSPSDAQRRPAKSRRSTKTRPNRTRADSST